MSEEFWPIIGVDESGKGDFFGPLVIGGVIVSSESLPLIDRLGIRDSKKIADGKILGIAVEIRNNFPCNVVSISPTKYNQLYAKIKNLNKLLGWGHARVIENLLADHSVSAAISDKFGNDRFINDSLLENGRKIKMIQRVRGESHPAVAAASILARAEFITALQQLEKKFGARLPKGASGLVDQAGRDLIVSRGEDILGQVAKLHFKNYQKILC